MDCFPVCQRGLPKKVGIRYNEHNSNRNEVTVNKIDITVQYLRACLKNHFRNLQAPLCGIFYPHSVAVARYAALIRIKSPTNWDSQLTESLFQTRSSSYKQTI